MELKLEEPEIEVLRRVLQNYLPNLREEVYKTENYDWRQDLKKDEEIIKGLIARLEALQVRS